MSAKRSRSRAIAYGRWHPYVDAEPTRAHIDHLRVCGLGLNRIAAAAGVSRGTLQTLVYGHPARGVAPATRLRTETAERLLAVQATPAMLGKRRSVDGTGTRRRLQGLVTIGWSGKQLAEQLGMDPSNLRRLLREDSRVGAGTARAVHVLYDQLWNRPPREVGHWEKAAAARARRYASDRGWASPLAWDNIDTDLAPGDQVADQSAESEHLDEIAIELAMAGRSVRLTKAERTEAIRQLHERGLSDRVVGERLGITAGAVLKVRTRQLAAVATEKRPAA